MGRPNELTGQVNPNTLSTPGGRRASLSPLPGAPGWTSAGPTSPTQAVAAPTLSSASTSARTGASRPARLWTLIVLGIIAFNVLRAIANGLGSAGADAPTTAPFVLAPVPTPAETVARATIDANVASGTVDFGRTQGASCTLSGLGTAFRTTDAVYWWAHFTARVPADTRVIWQVRRDDVVRQSGNGPDDRPTAPWDGLCGDAPLYFATPGAYVLEVWTGDDKILLAKGTFTMAKP